MREYRTGQVRAAEIGEAQVAAAEVGLPQVRIGEHDPDRGNAA